MKRWEHQYQRGDRLKHPAAKANSSYQVKGFGSEPGDRVSTVVDTFSWSYMGFSAECHPVTPPRPPTSHI